MEKAKIDEIYQKNAAMIYKYLCGLTQDAQLAEDLAQETFFQAIKGIDNFRGDYMAFGDFMYYLYAFSGYNGITLRSSGILLGILVNLITAIVLSMG